MFVFAWTALVVAGSGNVLSLDALVADRARREHGLEPARVVAIPFSTVQTLCGYFDRDRCEALGGAPCAAARCPVLVEGRPSGGMGPEDLGRRQLVLGGMVAGAIGALGLVAAALAAGLGRAVGGAPSAKSDSVSLPGSSKATSPPAGRSGPPTTATATSGPTSTAGPPAPSGTAIGPAKDVPIGGAARFTDPGTGDPSLVLQPRRGQFLAYDAVCPHAGCTVGYFQSADLLVCPCHGSQFNPATGDVEVGPASTGLRRLTVAEGPDGQLFVG